jgi:hypothetical protein
MATIGFIASVLGVAIDPETKAVPGFAVGKRNAETSVGRPQLI